MVVRGPLAGHAHPTGADLGVAAVAVAGGPAMVPALIAGARLARARGVTVGLVHGPDRAGWSKPAKLVACLSRAGVAAALLPREGIRAGLVITDRDRRVEDGQTQIRIQAGRNRTADDLRSFLTDRPARCHLHSPEELSMMTTIADYELIETIGQGNFGVYHLARPPARLGIPDEYVAVKVFGSGTRVNPTTFRRVVGELKAFGAVRSPHLVRLYDAGQERGTFYYAMEYFPGGSLAASERVLTRAESLRAVEQAARAAHDLHEAGLVHRDIKPGNVMLLPGGARLSDLGLAQVLAPGLTVTSFGGAESLAFLDPAVLCGARPSRASDIWALGVTLHIALTGTGVYPSFPQHDVALAMRALAARTPELDQQLSPAERALIASCLAAESADRPRTALRVADALAVLRQPAPSADRERLPR